MIWDGAGIGLAVGLLNHVARKTEEKLYIKRELRSANYDPDGDPKVTVEYAQEMLNTVKILASLKTLSDNKLFIKKLYDDPSVRGMVIAGESGINLSTTNKWTFSSNTTLALVIYHEGMHVVFTFNPTYKKKLDGYSGREKDCLVYRLAY